MGNTYHTFTPPSLALSARSLYFQQHASPTAPFAERTSAS